MRYRIVLSALVALALCISACVNSHDADDEVSSTSRAVEVLDAGDPCEGWPSSPCGIGTSPSGIGTSPSANGIGTSPSLSATISPCGLWVGSTYEDARAKSDTQRADMLQFSNPGGLSCSSLVYVRDVVYTGRSEVFYATGEGFKK